MLRAPQRRDLPRIGERLSFIYLEKVTIGREGGAISATTASGTLHIPAAANTTLILGPGCRITHRAIELLGESSTTVVWMGTGGLKYYAHGRSLNTRTHLITQQAQVVSHPRQRISAARKMYALRFPDDAIDHATMAQLRGKEGARIRRVYRTLAERNNIQWDGRHYDPTAPLLSDPVNQALSVAHSCLYGITTAVIVALGMTPALGIIHNGKELSLTYDIADIYKTEYSTPIAFAVGADVLHGELPESKLSSTVRRRLRNELNERPLIGRMITDIQHIFGVTEEEDLLGDILELWDPRSTKAISAGINWAPAT